MGTWISEQRRNAMRDSDLAEHRAQLAQFVRRYEGKRLFSTSAQVVTFASVLYNVSGSTSDPKVPGSTSWKGLLQAYAAHSTPCQIGSACYVTGPLPSGGGHPAFEVGGHMTTSAAGTVAKGGQCYLMPLCKWHNSTSKNGIAFSHSQTCMLQLSGYMQAEPAATFMARFEAKGASSIVYLSSEGLDFRPFLEAGLKGAAMPELLNLPAELAEGTMPRDYALLRRVEDDGETHYVVEGHRLSRP